MYDCFLAETSDSFSFYSPYNDYEYLRMKSAATAYSLFLLLIQIAGKLNKIIRESGLRDLGKLEQDLVFGDAAAKDVINFVRTKQVMHAEHS